MRQIVVNECRTLGSARGRREARLVRDERVIDRLESTEPDGGGLDLELVRRALERLTPDLREAFLLKHVEEHSYEEMVEIAGAGLSALKMRVGRQGRQRIGEGPVCDEARFDNGQVPRFLVEEIITAVGRKQTPPFDPMQLSHLGSLFLTRPVLWHYVADRDALLRRQSRCSGGWPTDP